MAKKVIITGVFLMLLVFFQHANATSYTLQVGGATTVDITDYPVSISLATLPQFSVEERSQLAVFVKGKQISSQLDDLDGDGIADELAFLVDVKAGKACKVTLKTIVEKKRAAFPKEVHAQMFLKGNAADEGFRAITAEGKHYGIKPVMEMSSTKNDMYNKMHHHGVAFESDKMAYRIYFDNKSTIDVYAKKTPRLELAESLWYPNDEQLAQGFGDDVLRVSGSVGVGAIKPWNGKKAVHIDKFEQRTQRILAQGNIRTVCETEVLGWENEGKKIDMKVRYILYARHRDVEVQVWSNECVENLVTGVQKIKGGELLCENDLVGCWGTDWPVNDTIKYAKETIGLGVYVPAQYVVKNLQDKQNNLLNIRHLQKEPIRFYLTVVSLKENTPPAQNAADFFAYLRRWKMLIENRK